MARGVNKVILVGNLGQDPEVRYMPNGNGVAKVTRMVKLPSLTGDCMFGSPVIAVTRLMQA